MLIEERRNFIMNEIKVRNRVLLTDLAIKLEVSEDTVRRDLKFLDKHGQVKKVHGGAISNSFHQHHQRHYKENEIYAYENKSIIAQKAHALLKEGQVILISGGTNNLELARLLPHDFQATVFTHSLPVAMQLLEHPLVETVFIGGRLSTAAQIALGSETVLSLSQLRADICFLDTGHLDPNYGLTEIDWDVVQLKKAMIQACKRIVVLTTSEKMNPVQRYKVCETQAVHSLITELKPNDAFLEPFRKQGIEII